MSALLGAGADDGIALLDADGGEAIRYAELEERVSAAADRLRSEAAGGLLFLAATNTAPSIVLYLACLEAGCPVALLDAGAPERLAPLLAAYAPAGVLLPREENPPEGLRPGPELPEAPYAFLSTETPGDAACHPELAVLLTTSGSTGNPKLVRLSRENLSANARSIARYLELGPGERSIQSLPMQYSYGLSLVNSHLQTGATVVLTRHSFMRPEFWSCFDAAGCTSFAGVPYMYETLHRLRFDPGEHPSLRTLTQAGGALRRDLIQDFHERARAADARLFVMYGQTEATARISYVPPEQLGHKLGSIGIPIPDGKLTLSPLAQSDQQELVYSGPNVMLGYAESAADLAKGDDLGGTLRTGDLARVDDDGFFFLTGRLKRFAKLYGRRVSLEDLEQEVERSFPVEAAAVEDEGRVRIHVATREAIEPRQIVRHVAKHVGVPPQSIEVAEVPEIPRTQSGKKDFGALAS